MTFVDEVNEIYDSCMVQSDKGAWEALWSALHGLNSAKASTAIVKHMMSNVSSNINISERIQHALVDKFTQMKMESKYIDFIGKFCTYFF